MLISLEPIDKAHDSIYDKIILSLKTNKPIVYSKINHGFWEQLVDIERIGYSYLETNPELALKADTGTRRKPSYFVQSGFVAEILSILKDLPKDNPQYIFSAGLYAYPKSGVVAGTPIEPFDLWQKKIDTYVPKNVHNKLADGVEFKRAIVNQTFKEFSDVISSDAFILVGNHQLKKFPEFIGANDYKYVEIDERAARKNRHEILKRIRSVLNENKQIKRILFQAGGSFSAWLIYNLYKCHPDVSMIDIGTSMNICNPATLLGTNFGKTYKQSILENIEKIHPGWVHKWEKKYGDTSKLKSTDFYEIRTGATSKFCEIFEEVEISPRETIFNPAVTIKSPLSFIENKTTDYERIKDFLSLSEKHNHHSNSGPVSRLLENCLESLLELPLNRKVIMCSSCTSGIHVASGISAIKSGRQLNWVTSAFGFMSSNIGPLSNIQIVDCAPSGFLDPDSLKNGLERTFGGVLYTNLFATNRRAWNAIRRYCFQNGKRLIIDNALGLLDRPQSDPIPGEIEVVSCHATKAWGVGEGGFMIIDAEDEEIARSLINFGVHTDQFFSKYAFNAKISDLSCAAILERLERLPHWSHYYGRQVRRIRRIVEHHVEGLIEFPFTMQRKSPTTNIQFLAEKEIPMQKLENPHFVMRKYYRPLKKINIGENESLENKYPNAESLYNRIINVPCHPYMRQVSSIDIVNILQNLTTLK